MYEIFMVAGALEHAKILLSIHLELKAKIHSSAFSPKRID